jgi:4,5:9,10-diseco-3-hydroxy-5,9,17-trioxoandrosta-1(10),2-diene-4-oate hydrolase
MAQAPAYTAEATSRFLEVDGVRLHSHEAGHGPPLLAMHGGGPGTTGWNSFGPNVPALAPHLRLLILDLPQFGQSTPVTIAEPRIPYYARLVGAFLAAIGIARVSIMGNSLGAVIGLRLAAEQPERVDKLILSGVGLAIPSIFGAQPSEGVRRVRDATEQPSEQALRDWLQAFMSDSSGVPDAEIAERLALANDPAAQAARSASSTVPYDALADAGKVRAKTLLLWGREDRATPLDYALTLLARLPDAQLHVFQRCGHLVQLEGGATYNRLVVDWIANE